MSRPESPALREPRWLAALLGGLAVGFLLLFLLLPVVVVFAEALSHGAALWAAAIADPAARAAIRLTLVVALAVVPANLLFGLAAAWAIARFRFPGRRLLTTAIDLPLSVSPVVSGLLFVLLFGAAGLAGPWLAERGFQILFALPGLVLATAFVTAPLVARQLIPLLETQGSDEEEAALTLGASGLQTFLRVSLPKLKWGILYGLILTNARAMGEFGAVSVVSGHVRGRTTTLPLHVEILYNEYQFQAAFAVASVLTLVALLTLAGQTLLEWRARRAESGGS